MMKKIIALRERDYIEKDKFDFAPMDFEDAFDSYDKVLEIIGDIAGNIIAENAASVDQEGPSIVDNEVKYAKGTDENYAALKQAGLIGLSLPRKYGGLNFVNSAFVLANEIVSRADAGFSNIWDYRTARRPSMNLPLRKSKMNISPNLPSMVPPGQWI
jgi:hypothetical protein